MEHKQIQTHYSTHKYLKSIRLQSNLESGQGKRRSKEPSRSATAVPGTLKGLPGIIVPRAHRH
jgi:hypothetical protein